MQGVVSLKGKETEGKLEMKRQRLSKRDRKDDWDRLSDLPDCVLLHIMEFMNIKNAVQTCVLSKRWKDLWKRLTNLTLHSLYSDFPRLDIFINFVSRILSCRDGSIPLNNLDLTSFGYIRPALLNRVMRYAALHNVQKLTIHVELNLRHDYELPLCIFSFRSLTYLELSIRTYSIQSNIIKDVKLPKSLELPALKSLHLTYVTFSTSDNGCADPFSTCNMLNTLVIDYCYLQFDAKVLCISNSKLSSLTIHSTFGEEAYKIALSTPNLSSLTIVGGPIHQLSSTCSLSFLEEVNIDVDYFEDLLKKSLVLISLLQVLSNVKIMTLSSHTLQILDVLSTPGSVRTQPPCFARFKSLKLKMKPFSKISDEEVSRIVEYLLQNSQQARVDIINC